MGVIDSLGNAIIGWRTVGEGINFSKITSSVGCWLNVIRE